MDITDTVNRIIIFVALTLGGSALFLGIVERFGRDSRPRGRGAVFRSRQ